MYDQGNWPHCTFFAVSTAFHLAINDIRLTVNEKDVRIIISQPFYNKMKVGIEPTELDKFHLDNVLVTDWADKGRQKYRAFLIRILSDNVEYIDKKSW